MTPRTHKTTAGAMARKRKPAHRISVVPALEALVLACELTGLQDSKIDWMQSNWDGPLQKAQKALGRCGTAFERQRETLEFRALLSKTEQLK